MQFRTNFAIKEYGIRHYYMEFNLCHKISETNQKKWSFIPKQKGMIYLFAFKQIKKAKKIM